MNGKPPLQFTPKKDENNDSNDLTSHTGSNDDNKYKDEANLEKQNSGDKNENSNRPIILKVLSHGVFPMLLLTPNKIKALAMSFASGQWVLSQGTSFSSVLQFFDSNPEYELNFNSSQQPNIEMDEIKNRDNIEDPYFSLTSSSFSSSSTTTAATAALNSTWLNRARYISQHYRLPQTTYWTPFWAFVLGEAPPSDALSSSTTSSSTSSPSLCNDSTNSEHPSNNELFSFEQRQPNNDDDDDDDDNDNKNDIYDHYPIQLPDFSHMIDINTMTGLLLIFCTLFHRLKNLWIKSITNFVWDPIQLDERVNNYIKEWKISIQEKKNLPNEKIEKNQQTSFNGDVFLSDEIGNDKREKILFDQFWKACQAHEPDHRIKRKAKETEKKDVTPRQEEKEI